MQHAPTPPTLAIDPERGWSRQINSDVGSLRDGDERVRNVGTEGNSRAGHPALLHAHVRRYLHYIDSAVVGVTARRYVPRAKELSVHCRSDATAPPRMPRHEMGDEPCVPRVVDDEVDQINGQVWHALARMEPALVASTANRAHEIATEQAHGRHISAGSPRTLDESMEFRVGGHCDQRTRRDGERSPLLSLADGHSWGASISTALDAATTPRNKASAACSALCRVAAIGATMAS